MPSQREELQALRDELAELRKQISALSVAIVELTARGTYHVQYVPYVPTPSAPSYPYPWSRPTINTYCSGTLGA